ncbi:hypothetical protein MTO96_007911 [Rhipicephalus appendiculatus]
MFFSWSLKEAASRRKKFFPSRGLCRAEFLHRFPCGRRALSEDTVAVPVSSARVTAVYVRVLAAATSRVVTRCRNKSRTCRVTRRKGPRRPSRPAGLQDRRPHRYPPVSAPPASSTAPLTPRLCASNIVDRTLNPRLCASNIVDRTLNPRLWPSNIVGSTVTSSLCLSNVRPEEKVQGVPADQRDFKIVGRTFTPPPSMPFRHRPPHRYPPVCAPSTSSAAPLHPVYAPRMSAPPTSGPKKRSKASQKTRGTSGSSAAPLPPVYGPPTSSAAPFHPFYAPPTVPTTIQS